MGQKVKIGGIVFVFTFLLSACNKKHEDPTC